MGMLNSKEAGQNIDQATSNTRDRKLKNESTTALDRTIKKRGKKLSTISTKPSFQIFRNFQHNLSNLRYIITEKPKWKVFKKKEIKAVPNYKPGGLKPLKGCPCGNDGPCKQKVTPNGVTIHYPQKRKKIKFGIRTDRKFKPRIQKSLYNAKLRQLRQKVKSKLPAKSLSREFMPLMFMG